MPLIVDPEYVSTAFAEGRVLYGVLVVQTENGKVQILEMARGRFTTPQGRQRARKAVVFFLDHLEEEVSDAGQEMCN